MKQIMLTLKLTIILILATLAPALPSYAVEYQSISGVVSSVTVNPMDGRYYNSMSINLVGFGPVQPVCYGTIQSMCQTLTAGNNVTLLTQVVRTAPSMPPFMYIVKGITRNGVLLPNPGYTPNLNTGSKPVSYSYELIVASGLHRMIVEVCYYPRPAWMSQPPQPHCGEQGVIAIPISQWCGYLRAIPIPSAVFTPVDLDPPGQAEAEAARLAAIFDCP